MCDLDLVVGRSGSWESRATHDLIKSNGAAKLLAGGCRLYLAQEYCPNTAAGDQHFGEEHLVKASQDSQLES